MESKALIRHSTNNLSMKQKRLKDIENGLVIAKGK